MLRLKIATSPERWDEAKEEFVPPRCETVRLEHSLISISKWEAKWNKPFLSEEDKTDDETMSYIECMCLDDVDRDLIDLITIDQIKIINDYISSPMTATTFTNIRRSGYSGQKITSELIYYWMIAYNIPCQYESWHLNRLLTLIEICNRENQPDKKMSRSELYDRHRAINKMNRAKYHTKG